MKKLFLIAGIVTLLAPVLALADDSGTGPSDPEAERTHGWICYNQTEWPPMHVCVP